MVYMFRAKAEEAADAAASPFNIRTVREAVPETASECCFMLRGKGDAYEDK